MDKLLEEEVNLVLYFIYVEKDLLIEWIEQDKYRKEVKLYELIGKKVMEIHIKKILNKILVEYDDIISKGSYNIENCKLVKYNIRLINKRLIKYK